jgi:hypothetical protein
MEAARVLAEHSWQSSPELNARLSFAFRRVLCRAPAEADLVHLRRAYEKQLAIFKSQPDAAKTLLAVGAAKRNEALDAAEHAALAAVCLGILNLDEALTRE